MEEKYKKAIETYQCPGCVCGMDVSCYEKSEYEKSENIECSKHVVGTTISNVGKIYLGLPLGFNRLGPVNGMKMQIFNKIEDGWGYCEYNVPIWKYKDEKGNVIVRGLSPRINQPFLHIFLEDCMKDINCLEITNADLEGMD